MSRRFFGAIGAAVASPPVVFPEVPSPFIVNTSASASYNAAGIPANFDAGATADKSHNLEASNVSGESIMDLLYSGAITKVFGVTQPWWGLSSHISNGTASNNTTQQQKQVAEMKRRGFAGVMPSWYGTRTTNAQTINAAVLKTVAQCNSQGMLFCLMWNLSPTVPADPTQDLKDQLDYADSNYFGQSSYLKISGRPVFLVFDSYSGTDWNAVRTHAMTLSNGNPWFLFRNESGFTHTQSDGAFSWIGANQPPDTSTDYLDSFYQTALTSGKKYFGSFYKGMDQTLASWSTGRFIEQLNGQTWLNTIGRIAANGYSSSRQLKYALTPWDDYEEGTEQETGIDTGITFSVSYLAPTFSWYVTAGNQAVIKQYDVLETTDDSTFHLLGSISVGATYSYAVHSLSSGTHKLYVVGRGVCSMATPVSSAVIITI